MRTAKNEKKKILLKKRAPNSIFNSHFAISIYTQNIYNISIYMESYWSPQQQQAIYSLHYVNIMMYIYFVRACLRLNCKSKTKSKRPHRRQTMEKTAKNLLKFDTI